MSLASNISNQSGVGERMPRVEVNDQGMAVKVGLPRRSVSRFSIEFESMALLLSVAYPWEVNGEAVRQS